eukprot:SAG22_NODE_2580_length_2419_cov_1.873276_2_plen_84_part_00
MGGQPANCCHIIYIISDNVRGGGATDDDCGDDGSGAGRFPGRLDYDTAQSYSGLATMVLLCFMYTVVCYDSPANNPINTTVFA